MKILSLFDGMACGALAMQAAGIEIEKYIAYEVDKYAIQTAQHNFPFIEERGDVFKADFTEYAGFDYLIGGSPCTYWSIAQTKNRETVASGMGWELFSQYVRALHEAKPRFFLYENNKSMSAAIRSSITETFGFEPILINSALVSAQNRQRLYWCGIRQADGTYKKADIQQPADRGILLKDILETNGNGAGVRDDGKAHVLTASYDGTVIRNSLERHQRTMAAEPICVAQRGRYDESGKVFQHYEAQPTGKTNNLTTVSKDNLIAEPVNIDENGKAHKLKAQYYKNGMANFVTNGGFNATAVAEPVPYINEIELVNYRVRKDSEIVITDRNMRCAKNDLKHSSATESVVMLPNAKSNALITAHGVKVFEKIAEPICVNSKSGRAGVEGLQPSLQDRVYDTAGKMQAVTTSFNPRIAEPLKVREAIKAPIYEVKDGFITVKGNKYPIKLVDGFYIIRKLTVRECMRLQTVPEWYEWPVSKSKSYKMLGNGWTVEVIAHILRGLK